MKDVLFESRQKVLYFSLSIFLVICLSSCAGGANGKIDPSGYTGKVKVACVGNSVTYGDGIDDRTQTYPAQLERMLGDKWEVKNFGINGATMLKKGDLPYWDQEVFVEAKAMQPDVVIIGLGANDSKAFNWQYKAEFKENYLEMINVFKSLKSKPKVWLAYPIKAFSSRWGIDDQVMSREMMMMIYDIGQQAKVPIIDYRTPMSLDEELLHDTIHPTAEGAKIIAQTVKKALTD